MSTPTRKAQLIGDLREQRDALHFALDRVSDTDRVRALFERDRERSSIHDELIRIADAEVTYRAWIQRARASTSADVRREPMLITDLDFAAAASYATADIMDVLAEERRQTLALIRDLEPAEFIRKVQTTTGSLSVDDLVGVLARHDRDLAQAITLRDATRLPRFYTRSRSSGVERG